MFKHLHVTCHSAAQSTTVNRFINQAFTWRSKPGHRVEPRASDSNTWSNGNLVQQTMALMDMIILLHLIMNLRFSFLLLAHLCRIPLACAQVLEVVAEETAEELSYMELLEGHPAEGEEADQTQKSSQSKLGAAKQQVTV